MAGFAAFTDPNGGTSSETDRVILPVSLLDKTFAVELWGTINDALDTPFDAYEGDVIPGDLLEPVAAMLDEGKGNPIYEPEEVQMLTNLANLLRRAAAQHREVWLALY